MLAEAISLLHDTGRFEQYKNTRRTATLGTENHSSMGLKILAETSQIFAALDEKTNDY
jgi:hypothetical protein